METRTPGRVKKHKKHISLTKMVLINIEQDGRDQHTAQ